MATSKSTNSNVKIQQDSKFHEQTKDMKKKVLQNLRVDILYAKIHRASVTDANLNYVGSISIDKVLMKQCGILEGMKVEILNVNNGERFNTYAIYAKKNSGIICLNGAAARRVQKGDIVIIIAYANVELKYAKKIKPKIIFVDSKNRIIKE